MGANALLTRLAQVYAGEAIRHPELKAITLAQWMLESGRGQSALAADHYNFGGLKWRPEMAAHATRILYQAHDGLDAYCKFATLESFIAGYWAFIARVPYSGWETHISSPEDYIRFIGPIYTPTRDYADMVLALENEARALLDAAADSPIAFSAGATDIGTIILDPGHGGTTIVGGSSPNNAISVSGVKEKKLTLDFCLILRDLMIEKAGRRDLAVNIILTRTTDVNLGIADRAAFAGKHGAKALLCLHFNGMPDPAINGAETYYRDAAHGNQNLAEDKAFAKAAHDGWIKGMRRFNPAAIDRGLKPESLSGPGRLGILSDVALGNTNRAKKCVAALMEGEFITNPTIDNLLISGPDAIRNRTAVLDELAEALIDYLRKN